MPKSRRMFAAALAGLLALSGCAAGGGTANSENPASSSASAGRANGDRAVPLVITTFTVLADLVRVVGGSDVEVVSITKPGAEIHGYEPTPSDLVWVREADLVIENGLGLESWFERFTHNIDAPTVTLSEGIPEILISVGEHRGQANPHAWMSPQAGMRYVDNAVAALSELLPSAAQRFVARGERYKTELAGLDAELRRAVQSLPPSQRMLVSCEGAFSYLARDVGLDEAYLWAVNQEGQGTPQQMVSLIDRLQDREVPAVFCESTVNHTAQRRVAEDTGARFGGTLYVDSLSLGEPVPSYLELLRHDISVIVAGLSGKAA